MPAAPVSGPWPFNLTVEDPAWHPEWIELEHVGTGQGGFLVVEMNMSDGTIRSSGPLFTGHWEHGRYPIAPVP